MLNFDLFSAAARAGAVRMCRFFAWLASLAAAGAVVAVLLALRLWVVLHSRILVPRQSLSLLVVAGSGKYRGVGRSLQTPECIATLFSGLLSTFGALHAELCSFLALPEAASPARAKCWFADAAQASFNDK